MTGRLTSGEAGLPEVSRDIGFRTAILCYHAVSSAWDCLLAVHPRRLEQQVLRFLHRGYAPSTLSDALRSPAGERRLVVTFDDAYRSVLLEGLPVLSRLGTPATVFVPTDLAATGGLMTDAISMPEEWTGAEEELRCMSWEEVRRLVEEGWEVGSHTRSHPRLSELAAEPASLELRGSREACEDALQRPCRSLAYPFGDHDRRTVELAAEAGYESAVTLGDRLLGSLQAPSRLELPRNGVYRGTPEWQLAAIASPAIRWARARSAFMR